MKTFIRFILLLGLTACAAGNTDNNTAGQQAEKDSLALHVAVMPTLDCLPFYYAEKCGIFDSLGVDVRLHTYRAQMDCDTAFAQRHSDVAYTDLIRAALLQSKGTGLYTIMQTDGYHELATAKSKRIRDITHLKEKMVAIARHSVTDMLLDTVLHDARLDPTTVYHPQINDIVLRYDMLRNGTIDAAFLPEPYLTQCRLLGDRSIYDCRKKNIRLMAFMASQQAVRDERKTEQIKLLVKGYDMAAEQLNQGLDKDSIGKILSAYPVSKETVDSLKLPEYTPARKVEPADVAVAVRFLRNRALIGQEYTGDTLINNKFIQ